MEAIVRAHCHMMVDSMVAFLAWLAKDWFKIGENKKTSQNLFSCQLLQDVVHVEGGKFEGKTYMSELAYGRILLPSFVALVSVVLQILTIFRVRGLMVDPVY